MRVMGYVNRFNRGIETSQQDLIENGNPPATFDFNTWGVFRVIANEVFDKVKNESEHVNEPEKLGEKLGENRKLIINLIRQAPYITIPEIAQKLSISNTAVQNNIKKLKHLGIIERIGPDKGGYWKVITKE
jgi:ATP-dependent DNA helicase RecG